MSKAEFGKPRYFIKEIKDKDKPSDPIILDAFNRIWTKLQAEIFLWDEFKIDLPFKSGKTARDNRYQDAPRQYLYRKDLQAMCFDENGRRKKLSSQQIKEIAETGRFTVKSVVNEKYDNTWLLGGFFQRGRVEINRRLQQRRISANEHWFLHLPEYFSGNRSLSLKKTLKNLQASSEHLIRVVFGRPEYRPRYTDFAIQNLLQKTRLSYLFSEVEPLPEKDHLWLYQNQLKLNALLVKPAVLSYLKIIIQQQINILNEKGETRDSALLLAVQQHPYTEKIDPELPSLLGEFHTFYHLLSPENPQFAILFEAETQKRDEQLKKQYPYRGRYEKWRSDQLAKQNEEICQQVRIQLTEKLYKSLDTNPDMSSYPTSYTTHEQYFLKKNMEYRDQYEETRKLDLSIKFRLAKVFKLPRIKWSFKALLADECLQVNNIHHSTDRSLWRLNHAIIQMYQVLSNNCLKLMRAWVYNPLGIKSVFTFSRKKFSGEIWLTDEGCPVGGSDNDNKYSTHITDVYKRWNQLREYRQEFEKKSDVGLFSRGVGRFFNRLYCYVLFGVVGTSIVLVLRYAGFLLLTAFIVLGLLLAPLWTPGYVILNYIFSILIYDYIGPSSYYHGRKRKSYTSIAPLFTTIVYYFLIRGVLFSGVSLLIITFHFLAAPVLNLFALSAYLIRTVWDLLIRLLLIYPFARVPGDNFSGIVTRIAGYGFASEVLSQVGIDEAMDKYQSWLEMYILDEYREVVQQHLNQSKHRLDKMMTQIYVSILGEHLNEVQKKVDKNVTHYEKLLEKVFYECRYVLEKEQGEYIAHYIRLSESDLPAFLEKSRELCKSSVESSLLSCMSDGEIAAYWSGLGVGTDEWLLLNRVLLSRAFSADIFTAIEDSDASITVQLNEQSTVRDLLMDKDVASKVDFNVVSHAQLPQTDRHFSFSDNLMWYELYSPLYIPVKGDRDWGYLQRLRRRYNENNM